MLPALYLYTHTLGTSARHFAPVPRACQVGNFLSIFRCFCRSKESEAKNSGPPPNHPYGEPPLVGCLRLFIQHTRSEPSCLRLSPSSETWVHTVSRGAAITQTHTWQSRLYVVKVHIWTTSRSYIGLLNELDANWNITFPFWFVRFPEINHKLTLNLPNNFRFKYSTSNATPNSSSGSEAGLQRGVQSSVLLHFPHQLHFCVP
jgi:hypothetical protein